MTRMTAALKAWLAHPLTRGLDVDDPHVTHLRREIIQSKPFLRQIYEEWYWAIAAELPVGTEPIVELGSGAGFLEQLLPNLVTTEVFRCPGVSIVLNRQQLPLARASVRAIVMVDVLHHLPQPRHFIQEANRCVRPGGRIVMLEPWVTPWSCLVYSRLHHEPFRPEAETWEFPSSGPLSGANGALPWMMFERDRARFLQEFPAWRIQMIRPMMPFRYLVSGDVSLRSLIPGSSYALWHGLEQALQPWMRSWAMFALIVLEKEHDLEIAGV